MLLNTPFSRNFQSLPRRFNGLCLSGLGYMPSKQHFVDTVFPTLNYSIILSGQGSYRSGQESFAVVAPQVITQFPGQRAMYGPSNGEAWEELYFILPPDKFETLQQRGLFGENPHGWPIRNLPAVLRSIRSLLPLIQNPARVDLVDHGAEQVIMETLLPGEVVADPATEAVFGLVQAMTAAPERHYDFEETARDYGVSYSTFQRRWRKMHPESPGQYLLSLRVSECCRLLAEADFEIHEVGRQMGFEDPAYFSRIFKKRIGMTPSKYRTLYSQGFRRKMEPRPSQEL